MRMNNFAGYKMVWQERFVDGNDTIKLYAVDPKTGNGGLVAKVLVPMDGQRQDTAEMMEIICKAYKARMNKSLL